MDSATDLDKRRFPFPTEIINVWGIPFSPALLIRYENTNNMKYLHPVTANIEVTGGTYDPLEGLIGESVQAVSGHAFQTDLVVPQPTRLPYWLWGMVGIMRPIGFTSPTWLLRNYLFRSL